MNNHIIIGHNAKGNTFIQGKTITISDNHVKNSNLNFSLALSPNDWRNKSTKKPIIDTGNHEKLIKDSPHFFSVKFFNDAIKMQNRICRININEEVFGTGFLINGFHILTCRHVIHSKENLSLAKAEFFYNNPDDVPRQFIFEDAIYSSDLDLALLKLHNFDEKFDLTTVMYEDMTEKNTGIVIIQHPNGDCKKIAAAHSSLVYKDDTVFQYTTDTLPGSSGAPVFDLNFRFLGIHSKGGNLRIPKTENFMWCNEGIYITAINSFLMRNNIIL